MKFEMTHICKSVLFAGLVSAPFAMAVERPADLDEKPHQLKAHPEAIKPVAEKEAENWLQENKVAVKEAIPEQMPQQLLEQNPEQMPVQPAANVIPYLGVGSTPIDELLSGHLGVDHGVVVQQVHEGSGAFKAGLRKNDILMSFDGKQIASPLDLRDAVKARQVGDEVVVEFIRGGEKQKNQVVLESRPQGLPNFVPEGLRGMGNLQQVWPGVAEMPLEAQEQIEKLRNMMEAQRFDGDAGLGLKLNQLLEGNLPNGEGQIDLDVDARSSVTWSDGEGSITMNMRKGQSEVQVRDNNGDVVFEGPWETDQDKAAVDPVIRERIENMGVQRQGNQLKFFMEGLPGGR